MLTLNVKSKFYDMIIERRKTTEYREAKGYWITRLSNIKIGDKIKIVRGYKYIDSIIVELIDLDIYVYDDLPFYAKEFFTDEKIDYYAIRFKLL